ncbi:MAG: flagellar filament capping protein FliD [Sphingomonadaceae bacterium]
MNLISALNAGSGIDMATLVKDLVAAQRAPQAAILERRAERVEARITALSQFRAALDALNSALVQRIDAGAVSPVPRVSDPTVLTFRMPAGGTLPAQQVEVKALATAQALAAAPVTDLDAPVGQGTLTFAFGKVGGTEGADSFETAGVPDLVVTIDETNDSLTGLRNAINDAAAQAGVNLRAEFLADADGTRLVIRGQTGEANGFLVIADGDPGLESFAFAVGGSGGLARTTVAADAQVAISGVTLRRPTNEIADLVPGAILTLFRAAPGTQVTLVAERSGAELAGTVRDLGGALGELLAIGRELSRGGAAGATAGALASDSTMRRVVQNLTTLTTRALIEPNGNAPTRLSEIGISITREGAITINEQVLTRAVTDHPGAVERIVRALGDQGGFFTPGGPLRQMANQLRDAAEGRFGQPTALQREARAIARARAELDQRMERLEFALTRQFALVDSQVGATRATETFLRQQIDIWFRGRNR